MNKWDPIGVIPYAPDNEYEIEVIEILNFIESNDIISTELLASKIECIFKDRINCEGINIEYSKCYEVASEILKRLKSV